MQWVTWQQAATASAGLTVAWLVLRGRRPSAAALAAGTQELALISALYAVWRLGFQLPLTHEAGALDRARQIAEVQERLHLPSELSVQQAVLPHDWLANLLNDYYAVAHVPGLVVFMIWLFVRHRDCYPHWRNGLALLTGASLLLHFVRVAPPRFILELGFVDLSQRFGFDVYGPPGSAVSDQFAAMPSIHVGWAAVVALGAVAASRSAWRWVAFSHLPLTVFAVTATGHHWWLDGAAAIALLLVGLRIDTVARRRIVARRRTVATVQTPAI
ncbi:MAG: phosphatase PAP2 family protein [Aeromicrobium sp.]